MVELAVWWGVVVVVVVAELVVVELLVLVELLMLRPLALEPAELAFVVLVALNESVELGFVVVAQSESAVLVESKI